ncbi:MAG: NAD(P)-dependent oxidoreductase [Candidatus Berkelbacteria bacterium]
MIMFILFVFALVSIMIGISNEPDQNNAVCPIADKQSPFTVIIIGMGRVGTAMAEHYRKLGHKVIGVDSLPFEKLSEKARTFQIYSPDHLPELIKMANVVCICVPISEIAKLINLIELEGMPGLLVINNGSVANPTAPNEFWAKTLTDKGMTYAHHHPMHLTVLPLSVTLYGENHCLTIEGPDSAKWQGWTKDQFVPYGAIVNDLQPRMHDEITVPAQLCHMITAVCVSEVICETPEDTLKLGLTVGGYPAQALLRSVVRSMNNTAVIGQILTSHPHALATLDLFQKALDRAREAIVNGDSTEVESRISSAYKRIDIGVRDRIEASIEDHMQFDADCRKPNAEVKFTADENVIGLLGKVLEELDSFGIDKTSTYARNLSDGGCKFIFGVRTQEEKDLADRLIRTIKLWVSPKK